MDATRFPFLDWPGPIAFAHQGGADEFPENTLKAFQSSAALGYRYMETDVHVTSDGVVVVMHDDTLDRTTDRAGTIARLPWNVVKEARVGGTEPVPRVDEVLEAMPDTRFNIEPKADAAVEPLIDVIRCAGALDRVCVGSFKDRRVTRARQALGPKLCTAAGTVATARVRFGSWLPGVGRFVAHSAAACLQVPVGYGPVPLADRSIVRFAHAMERQVHVWTINDASEMTRLLDVGVDGIMTDRPSVLKDVLVSRGQWVQ
jgi:glycerophosphoryl diester phosphodiesterase